MADITDSLYGMICEIVRSETLFLRHYIGQVMARTDELNIGCLKVSVPELGWTTADMAPICYPRQLHGMSVPEVDEWVEVYFLNGDRNRPVYMGLCNEMKNGSEAYCVPEWYTGDPTMRVLYQSPTSGKGIKLDDTSGEMTIDAGTVILQGDFTTIKSPTQSMKALMDGLLDLLTNFATAGSPVAHVTDPATKALIAAEKIKWGSLLK